MSDEQRIYWQEYVDTLKPMLKLTDWKIQVMDDPPDRSDAHASMECIFGQRVGMLRLCVDFTDDLTREGQRETIAHEMMHCHTNPPWMAVGRITNQLGPQAEAIADDMVREHFEHMTDAISRAFAPFLPLPPKIKREKKAA